MLSNWAHTCKQVSAPWQRVSPRLLAGAGFGAVKSERPHIAIRARSSLARHSGKAATLKALKNFKGCLCASAPEEQLPLFQIHCTDFRRSMDAAGAQVNF